jgi:hypothetical protein
MSTAKPSGRLPLCERNPVVFVGILLPNGSMQSSDNSAFHRVLHKFGSILQP